MFKLLFHNKNKNFARLWWAQLISQFGDRIHQLALVGLIAERAPGSAMGLAKLLSFTILPVFLIQPIAGVFIDRWDRRTTLFICDLARGGLVLLIPLYFIEWNSIVPIYIIVFLVFSFSRFYVPAKMSIIPDLVDEDNLLKANSLVSTTGMLAFVLGAALGGFLIEWYGARNGFIIDAGTYFISAVFLFSMALSRDIKEQVKHVHLNVTAGRTFVQDMKEGIRYLIDHKEIRFIIDMLFAVFAAAGAVYVVIIVFIQQAFASVTRDLGILAIFLGVGLFTGVLVYGKWGKNVPWYKTIFYCLIAAGFMMIAFAVVVHYHPNLWTAMGLAFLLGWVMGPIFIAANTMTHLVCHDAMRGKVFSALEVVTHFAFLIAMLLSSWLSEFVPRVWILSGVGVAVAVVGGMGIVKKEQFVTENGL